MVAWLRAGLMLVSLIFLPAASLADNLARPSGRVLLSVTGAIANTNDGGTAAFDRQMLEALDWREVESFTHWTEGSQSFAGPTLASVLAAAGARGDSLTAIALNDFRSEIPALDAQEYEVILALDQGGRPMRVRDKGPIWIIYPQDESAAARGIHNDRMVWQLREINVRE